jgi:dTDP-4-amino-4,6-dideoxygalactose transaminase
MEAMASSSDRAAITPVPMLDFSRSYAVEREEILAALTEVCDAQRFILGPAVERFETEAAAALHVAHAIGCSSGTDALWLALRALDIGHGDRVLTSPFSFFATASCIVHAGATPVFADIDPLTFNLSSNAVEDVLQRDAANVKALLPVHLYGQCADMTALTVLAEKYSLTIVEDAAQAIGATWQDTPAGSLGAIGCFSFYPTKNLAAAGDAGLCTTGDAALAERLATLRAHGMKRRYFHDEVGWNCRIDAFQAAVLSVRLKRLDAGNEIRRALAARYDTLFQAAGLAAEFNAAQPLAGIVLPHTDPRATPVFHQYVIRAPRRDDLRAALAARQIGTEVYYPLCLHQQQALASLGYTQGDFPHAERAAEEVLALPMYPELREAEQQSVVEAIRRFYA